MSTGNMLWELEILLFVAVCSPCCDSAGSYAIWGHSMIVGPNGKVLAITEHEEKIVIAEIDYAENLLHR
ncbi:Omega-amidase chloroplastic [Bienertia sinuspersici]